MENKTKLPPLAQLYERIKERVYIIERGLIFKYEEIVCIEKLESKLILDIVTEKTPR